MKGTAIFILSLSFIILLSACDNGGVSKEDYDSVLTEIERLKEPDNNNTNTPDPSPDNGTHDITIQSPTPLESDNDSELLAVYKTYYEILRAAIDAFGVADRSTIFDGETFGVLDAVLVDFDNDEIPEFIYTRIAEVDFAYPMELIICAYGNYGEQIIYENHGFGGNFDWGYRLATGISGANYLVYTSMGNWRKDTFTTIRDKICMEVLHIESGEGEYYLNGSIIPELSTDYDDYWENRNRIHEEITNEYLEQLENVHFSMDDEGILDFIFGSDPHIILRELEELIN